MSKRRHVQNPKTGRMAGSVGGAGQTPPAAAPPTPAPAGAEAPEAPSGGATETHRAYKSLLNPHPAAFSGAPPDEITELVDGLAFSPEEVWFPNHNSTSDEEWLNLQQLADEPSLARNNCHSVTFEVHREIAENVGHPHPHGTAELVFESGVHWANIAEDAECRRWAVDYTARQFDPTLPCPLVEPADRWQTRVETAIREQYGDVLQESNFDI